jgi:hypothetical protein
MEGRLAEAESCLRLGLRQRAEALLIEVLEVEVTDPTLCERVRDLHSKLGRKGDIAQELIEMARAASENPSRAEAYLEKALCLTVMPEAVWKTARELGIHLVAGPCGLDESTEPETDEQPQSSARDLWDRRPTDVQIQRVLELVARDERRVEDVAAKIFDEFGGLAEGGWLLRRVTKGSTEAFVTSAMLPATSSLSPDDQARIGLGAEELQTLLKRVASQTPVASLISPDGVWCYVSDPRQVALMRIPQTHLGRVMSRAQRLSEEIYHPLPDRGQ